MAKLVTDDSVAIVCKDLADLVDYCQPLAKGALLKTVLLYTKTLRLDSNQTLAEQLQEKLGGGIELACCAELPQGTNA